MRQTIERLREQLARAEAEHPTGVCLERVLRAERDKLRRDLDHKDHELADFKAQLAEARAEVAVLTEKLSLVTEDYIKHRNALEKAEAEVERLRDELARLKAQLVSVGEFQTLLTRERDEAHADLRHAQAAVSEQYRRAEAAEAKLARCVEALESIASNTCCDSCQEAALVARAALGRAER
jgi:chromosome segregation ATPase